MNRHRNRILLLLIFLATMLYQVKDIVFADGKIIAFIGLLGVVFYIIYYFSFTIFKK